MFQKLNILLLIIILSFWTKIEISLAYIFYSDAATPSAEQSKTKFLITEVSFKNDQNDYIKLKILDTTNSINTQGYSIRDDSPIFIFEDETLLQKNDVVEIYFNEKSNSIKKVEGKLIIAVTKKGLTSTSEQITLLNNQNHIIDAVCFENKSTTASEEKDKNTLITIKAWQGACIDSNEVNTNDYIQRTNDQDTNSKNDWEVLKQTTITPSSSSNTTTPATTTPLHSDAIQISEFLPNPFGKDQGNEWIELFNSSSQDIDLTGWQLDDSENSNKPYKFSNTILKAKSYLVISDEQSKIILNNGEDSVRLITPEGKVRSEVIYEDSPEGYSYAFYNGSWQWTEETSPGKKNIIISTSEKNNTPGIIFGDLSDSIFFSEVFPNPEGTDKSLEWVELYNNSNEDISLAGWQLNNVAKSKTLEAEYYIQANNFLVISDSELGFSLKNSNETLTLLDFNNKIIDTVEYSKSVEGKSLSRLSDFGEEAVWDFLDPSPEEKNSALEEISGTIKTIDDVKNSIIIENENMELLPIFLNSDLKQEKIPLQIGQKITATVQKNPNDLSLYKIESIEAPEEVPQTGTTEKSYKTEYLVILLAIISGLCGLLYFGKKILPKIDIKKCQYLIRQKIKKSLHVAA